MRVVWLILGLTSLGLGGLGVVTPLLPTTPFVILAAFCFARSSPRLHEWLHQNPVFGKAISDWNASHAISRRGKVVAVSAMAASLALSAVLGVGFAILGLQALVLLAAAAFILTRNTAV
jgi:uncharacterized membrane protein YbaN (DUF454 family)